MNKFHRFIKGETNPFLRVLKIIGLVVGGLAVMAGLAILFGFIVMHLWNWLMPEIFGLTTLTFWQSVGLVILARLIFGGFKHGHDSHHCDRHTSKKRCTHSEDDVDWSRYYEYWQKEGKAAFKKYVDENRLSTE
jgi:hypothetical protein